jgi:hypothetical protein
MIRARFKADGDDYRPVAWPINHPYWCTGYGYEGDGYSIVVAYADDKDEILRLWTEAWDIEAEIVTEYVFTSRFPKPAWFKERERKE